MKVFEKRIEKDFEQFVRALPRLDPVEFYGLAKILSAKTVDEEGNALPLDAILEPMMDRFLSLNKRRRREILGVLKDVKREMRANGTTT